MKHNNSDSQLAAALNKPVVSGKLTDEEIWQWVEWIDKRCNFNDHQKDYVWFAIRQILKTNSACAAPRLATPRMQMPIAANGQSLYVRAISIDRTIFGTLT